MDKPSFSIQVPPIFNWEAILGYLGREPKEVMYEVNHSSVRRAFKIAGNIYLCEVNFEDASNSLQITILNTNERISRSVQDTILAFIEEWFDLSTDLRPFYALAKNDHLLNQLIIQFDGLRLVGMPDFYEAITWGILGQQINLGYTYTLKRRFTEAFGEKIVYQGRDYWIYPDPKVIAQLPQEDILALRLTQRKAEYLHDISTKISNGEISKQGYQRLKTAESAEKQMVKLRGIGPWTANYVLMRCLRLGDAFPMADIGLLNGIKEIQGLPAKPELAVLKKLKVR